MGPVRKQVEKEKPSYELKRDFARDMFNVVIGNNAQTCLVAAPIFLVVREMSSLALTLLVFAVSAVVLKKTWYDNLERSESATQRSAAPGNA
jgi:hypothetical protein